MYYIFFVNVNSVKKRKNGVCTLSYVDFLYCLQNYFDFKSIFVYVRSLFVYRFKCVVFNTVISNGIVFTIKNIHKK